MGQRIADAESYAGQPFPRRVRAIDIEVDAALYATRHAMAAALMTGVMGEVGTWLGGFASYLLEVCAPTELHLFERDVGRIRPLVRDDDRVRIHHGDSSKELEGMPRDFFDCLYIDADHSLAGVARDAEVAKRKVRPGGLLIFNDYCLWSVIEQAPYGIPHAVSGLCIDDGFRIVGFAFQFQGYHDIALRRPP